MAVPRPVGAFQAFTAALTTFEEHMARRKSKKSPEDAPVRDTPGSASVSERQASSGMSHADAPTGMVRKSTCLMSMLLTLALGLYLGGLLPGLLNSGVPAVPPHAAPPQPEAAPPASPAPQAARPAQDNQPPMPPELVQKITDLEKALLTNPKDAARWTALGNLYFDTGQAKQAISAYERSLMFAPGNPDVLTDLGIMYREAGAYEQAVDSFRKATAANPGHENALFNEGVVLYYDLHRKDEATRAWQRLLKVNPGARSPDGQPVSEMIKHLH